MQQNVMKLLDSFSRYCLSMPFYEPMALAPSFCRTLSAGERKIFNYYFNLIYSSACAALSAPKEIQDVILQKRE